MNIVTNVVESSGMLERVLDRFSSDQKGIIMENLGAFQLTEGCSLGCSFCGFEAAKKVRDYVRFEAINDLVSNYGDQLGKSRPFLYYGSDPFDYDFEGHNYLDVHRLVESLAGYSPFVSTSVPKGKEEFILKLVLEPAKTMYNNGLCLDFSKNVVSRVSLSAMNEKRIRRKMWELVPGLDPSLQELRTEGSYDFRFLKYPDGREMMNNRSGDQPITYRDVIRRFTEDSNDLIEEDLILKLGERNKEDLSEHGIGCFHGVLMTPLGAYNVGLVNPSREHPQGQILTPIDPMDFSVIQLERSPWENSQKNLNDWSYTS